MGSKVKIRDSFDELISVLPPVRLVAMMRRNGPMGTDIRHAVLHFPPNTLLRSIPRK